MNLKNKLNGCDSKDCVVIASACLSNLSEDENIERDTDLCAWLLDKGYKYNAAIDYYKGSRELSVVIRVSSNSQLEELRNKFFNDYNQECILVRSKRQGVWLRYPDRKEKIGDNVEQVSISEAMKHDSCTLMKGKGWIVK